MVQNYWRIYIAIAISIIAGGDPFQRVQLQQLEPIETNKEPQHEYITHNCPQAAQLYYLACGKIDQHSVGKAAWQQRRRYEISHGTNG
jgi:hypothetical protein